MSAIRIAVYARNKYVPSEVLDEILELMIENEIISIKLDENDDDLEGDDDEI